MRLAFQDVYPSANPAHFQADKAAVRSVVILWNILYHFQVTTHSQHRVTAANLAFFKANFQFALLSPSSPFSERGAGS